MPYQTNTELPDSVKNHLSVHAQTIYREVFNHALVEYRNPQKRRDDASAEEVAHRVAWAAVKKKYHKTEEGEWVEI